MRDNCSFQPDITVSQQTFAEIYESTKNKDRNFKDFLQDVNTWNNRREQKIFQLQREKEELS